MTNLAARLEAAPEGSRKLSREVVDFLGVGTVDGRELNPTCSLDDCARLTPEEMRYDIISKGSLTGRAEFGFDMGYTNIEGVAETLALAWTAALLRAEAARREAK